MDIKDFLKNFADQFDETSPEEFTSETRFKDLSEWSSLIALLIIAMIDDEYNITITGEAIRNSATIGDLFNTLNKN